MPTTYATATDAVMRIMTKVLKKTFAELDDIGLQVEVLMAANDTGPAVKAHGWPALAKIKIMKLEDRIGGSGDVRIIIDAARWEELSEPQRVALFDHELTHVELQKDRDGKLRKDDADRPVIKLRQHDFELGGFWDTVERHKEAAPESTCFDQINRGFTQREFPWGMM